MFLEVQLECQADCLLQRSNCFISQQITPYSATRFPSQSYADDAQKHGRRLTRVVPVVHLGAGAAASRCRPGHRAVTRAVLSGFRAGSTLSPAFFRSTWSFIIRGQPAKQSTSGENKQPRQPNSGSQTKNNKVQTW